MGDAMPGNAERSDEAGTGEYGKDIKSSRCWVLLLLFHKVNPILGIPGNQRFKLKRL